MGSADARRRVDAFDSDRFVATVRVCALAAAAYGGSIVATLVVLGAVRWDPAASVVLGAAFFVLGPVVLAWYVGRLPPLLFLGMLVAGFYIMLALGANTYDSPRWSGTHLLDAVFLVCVQCVAALTAVAIRSLVDHRTHGSNA